MLKKILVICLILLVSNQVAFAEQKYPELCPLFTRKIGLGDSGLDVKRLQVVLGKEGMGNLNATGYFGPATAKAVGRMQKSLGLTQTGGVGPKSLKVFYTLWCQGGTAGNGFDKTPKPVLNQNYSEYDKFAQCIKNSGAKLYCTSWSPYCQNQKNLFNSSSQYLPYVECSDASGQNQTQICNNNNVNVYPTWDFYVNGLQNRTTGQKTLQELAQSTNCPLPAMITKTNQNGLDFNYSYSKSGYKSWTLNESGMYGEGANLNFVSGNISKEVSVIYNQDGQKMFNINTTYTNNSNIQNQINTCYENIYLPVVNKYYYYAYSTGYFYNQRPVDLCTVGNSPFRKINPGEKVLVSGRFNISQNMINIAKSWGLINVEIGEANYDKISMPTQDR